MWNLLETSLLLGRIGVATATGLWFRRQRNEVRDLLEKQARLWREG
jgi:hypothetical protein